MEAKHPLFRIQKTVGEKSADKVVKIVGSWMFIISFLIFIFLWMGANLYAWLNAWDPYPFILLNLVLSTIAAVQAPIILMSQNRQEKRDRMRMEYDYEIDKKAEKEIREIKEMLIRMNRR